MKLLNALMALTVLVFGGERAWARADYSLQCNLTGRVATVYGCNDSDSSLSDSGYLRVTACGRTGTGCDTHDQYYWVHIPSGECIVILQEAFNSSYDLYCTAVFRR